ncbi:DMT family transporter [Micromonospora zhanjiangensis]|uniref:DMT family transporter n=1 Tax=Micromonospora zhanjiangensis TaxID=1522057 RepID=A0ABV8KU58_9ACTN
MTGGARGWGRIGVLALLWGSTFLWIELALRTFTPVQVTVARCVLGATTLLVGCLAGGRRLPRGRLVWTHLTVAALFCNALPFALFSIGQRSIDSGLAGVLNATTPLWSLLIGVLIGTERGPRPVRLVGLLLGFVGVALIFAPWRTGGAVGPGALAVLVAAASYAVGFAYVGRYLVGRGVPTISLSAGQLVVATGLTVPLLPTGGPVPVHVGPVGLAAVLVLGVVATGVTFHLTYRIIAAEGATDAATVGYLLPVVSVALGAVVLGEAVGLRVVAGMAVVLVGVALTRRTGTAPPSVRSGGPLRPSDRTLTGTGTRPARAPLAERRR